MKKMDAMMLYWNDPDAVIVPANQTDDIIAWLANETPDTWHRVACTWNYDHNDKVLSWILRQPRCDRGTAAQVFRVQGIGHWLGDQPTDNDSEHLCRIALENWQTYASSELRPTFKVTAEWKTSIRKMFDDGRLAEPQIVHLIDFEGTRDASSKFESEDGKIVIAFDHWLTTNNIVIS